MNDAAPLPPPDAAPTPLPPPPPPPAAATTSPTAMPPAPSATTTTTTTTTPPPSTTPAGRSRPRWGGIVAGAALVIGGIAPWATVSSIFGTVNVAGTNGDGWIVIVVGALTIFLFAIARTTAVRVLRIVAGAVAVLVAVIDVANVQRVAQQSTDLAEASVGWGLWLCLVAAFAVLVLAIITRD